MLIVTRSKWLNGTGMYSMIQLVLAGIGIVEVSRRFILI